ncbi:MAG: hypothetical protein OSB62_01020 [Alphaproteobacteria bacterium]|nr:hypothetical protein [Alphaproteobacteria bacterium]
MPAIAVAAAGYAAAHGAAALGLSAATAAFAATAASTVVAASMAQSPRGLTGNRGLSTTLRSSIESHKVIYGTARTGGVIAHISTVNSTLLPMTVEELVEGVPEEVFRLVPYNVTNGTLYMAVAFTGHEVDGLDTLYLDGVPLTLDEFDNATNPEYITAAGYPMVNVKFYSGESTQTADPDMVRDLGEWTEAHRLQGVSYARIRLLYNDSAYPNGIPNVTAKIRGKKLYDPRSGVSAYSDNWALAVRDYLTNPIYGLGCAVDEIDEASIMASADISDEPVNLKGGGTVKRYTVNGVLDTANTPLTLLETLTSAGAGAVPYIDGAFHVLAGAYDAPSATLDADWLRGEINIHAAPSLKERFNTVRGVFADPEQAYQIVDFPEVKDDDLVAALGGTSIASNIELPLTNHIESAQRIAALMLSQSGNTISLSVPLNLKGMSLKVWDVINLNLPELGWENKLFRITHWQMSEDGGVDINLKEESASAYDWDESAAKTVSLIEEITLPTGREITAPGIPELIEDLYVTTDGSGVKARITATWADANDAFAIRYRIKLKKAGESAYTTLGETAHTQWVIEDLAPGEVTVQVVSVSPLGIESDPSEATLTVEGLTAAPADIENFNLSAQNGQAHLSWLQAEDIDVKVGGRIRLRHSAKTSGATWSTAVDLVPALAGISTHAVVPLLEGTYMVKAVDSTGNESVSAAAIITTAPQVVGMNVIETLTPAPTFDGALMGFVHDTENIILDGLSPFDDATGDFDDALGSFDGYGGFVTTGTYTLADHIDLGSIYTSRVRGRFIAEITDSRNVFDVTDGEFDSRTGKFDGDDLATIDVSLEVRSTQDDPASSPVWTVWQPLTQADITARGFEFRVVAESANSAHNVQISDIHISVDMPDRLESHQISVGTGGMSVSFAQGFYSPPAVSLTLQNGISGDYFSFSGVTNAGFDVTVYNSAGSAVARDMTYVARGY